MNGRVWLMVACGVAIVLIGGGLRQAFGVFLYPVTLDLEMSRQFFGLVMAAQALIYGLSQPIAGLLADRFGPIRVIVAGALLYAIGLYWSSISSDSWDFMMSSAWWSVSASAARPKFWCLERLQSGTERTSQHGVRYRHCFDFARYVLRAGRPATHRSLRLA